MADMNELIYSFAGGAEILKYFQDTATKFDLNKYIELKHKVTGAVWDEDEGKWTVTVENQETGKVFEDYGHFLINGSGFLKYVFPFKVDS